ncbi:MAG TPA: hypothetical protein VHS75_10390, partial [Phenylobacterium sp.]|nr:hypothetical protein [Phenylobacterium sp.]
MSMLADQGEMEQQHAAGALRGSSSITQTVQHAVATHPFKRLLDVSIAGFALLLFLPLLLVVMAAIRAESPGGAIFRQRR